MADLINASSAARLSDSPTTACLDATIGAEEGWCGKPRQRRYVDHVPGSLSQHGWQEGAQPVGDAEHVDAEGPGPVAGLAVPQWAEPAAHAGVVDKQVDPAEARQDGVRQPVHGCGVGDVAGMRVHDEAACVQRGLRGLECRSFDIGQDDAEAAGAQGLGQGKPDSAGRARDDGDLSMFQFHVASQVTSPGSAEVKRPSRLARVATSLSLQRSLKMAAAIRSRVTRASATRCRPALVRTT